MLKATHHTYFEGGVDAYRRFMSVNTLSPIIYLTKNQLKTSRIPSSVLSASSTSPLQSYRLTSASTAPSPS